MSPDVSSSPQVLRRANRLALLDRLRRNGAMTGTDLMNATGLTRATVHGVCDDLIDLGWVIVVEAGPDAGPVPKGRPARVYEFNARGGVVLGIDMGYHRVTVLVTDMRGETLAQQVERFDESDTSAPTRIDTIDRCARRALAAAATDTGAVLAVGVGVAAPVDALGRTVPGNEFWTIMNVDIGHAFGERYGWPVVVDNDANLAALAERWRGHCTGSEDFAVILAGERLGSGLVVGGRVLHGSQGAAGEMAYLASTEGVGGAEGIAMLAVEWGAAEVQRSVAASETDRGILVRLSGGLPSAVTAEMVFEAAKAGDAAALAILDRLGERFARVIATLSTLVNPEIVVLAGAIAEASRALIPTIEQHLPLHTLMPPRIFASALGSEIVSIGAVRTALDHTEVHALDLSLAAATVPAGSTVPAGRV
ncbi:ROK family protein [Cryobacterium lactosi]|uniref:ROK family protein n=1 Tax=Cryobacterium lactosi TaxID=1259202 RepID=A0A4R9BPX5_9MICO|nr:ROK family transcriptional regulator [Cryobacterium lactosi]TFD88525.1 ROK family protein [Cryobacterium lactosi]